MVVCKNNFCALGPKLNGRISVCLFCTGLDPMMRQAGMNVMAPVLREFKNGPAIPKLQPWPQLVFQYVFTDLFCASYYHTQDCYVWPHMHRPNPCLYYAIPFAWNPIQLSR